MSILLEHHKIYSAAYIVLLKDESVLLGRRYNTGYMDGKYGLPAGHIEKHEPATLAAVREAFEEVGVRIDPADLKIAHVIKRLSSDGREYVDFFFIASKWVGEPRICEPDKCDNLRWFPLSSLPDVIPYEWFFLEKYLRDSIFFSEYGYEAAEATRMPEKTCSDDVFDKEIALCKKLSSENGGKCGWGNCKDCGVIAMLYKLHKGVVLEGEDLKCAKGDLLGIPQSL